MRCYMNNRALSYLFAVGILIIAPMSYYYGYNVGLSKNSEINSDIVQSIAKKLPDGTAITIEYEDGTNPSVYHEVGSSISAKSETWLNRTFSFFGEGAIEGFDKMKNMQISDTGVDFGEQRGYGVLEKLWSRIKSVFWVGTILLIILFAMAFIEPLAPIAKTILRAIASIFPVIGSLVERAVASFKVKEKELALKQIVKGGQKFKEQIKTGNHLDAEHKDYVINTFKQSHQVVQDEHVQKLVKNLK